MCLFFLCCLAGFLPLPAHGQKKEAAPWIISLGAGFAVARIPYPHRDTIYQGGLQSALRFGLGHLVTRSLGVGLEFRRVRESGMGNCLSGSGVCGRHLEYNQWNALVMWKSSGKVVVFGGPGLYRLPESRTTSATTVIGLDGGIDLCLGSRRPWLCFDIRGMYIPAPPGPNIYGVGVGFGFRQWPADRGRPEA